MAEHAPVLVVDDDRDIAALLAEILGGAGYAVQTATDGSDALRLVDEREYALILLDLRMPVIDGKTFLEVYAARQHTAPVVVVTATREVDGDCAKRAVAIVRKPFEIETIVDLAALYAG